jgi:hypothetical protein
MNEGANRSIAAKARARSAHAVSPARNAQHFAPNSGGLAPAAEDEAAEGDAQSERAEGERADRD